MTTSPLYAITDTRLLENRLLASVEAALKGGCRWIQYRDKSRDEARRRQEARALLGLCRRYQARLLINDDLALAHETGADGVHLGQGDGDPGQARHQLGPDALIGVTCHDSLSLAHDARAAGASYAAFGRFFASQTKPGAPPAPKALLTRAREELPGLPLVAIGGVTLDNGGSLLQAGADRLAVSHHLFSAPDIEARARAFRQLARPLSA